MKIPKYISIILICNAFIASAQNDSTLPNTASKAWGFTMTLPISNFTFHVLEAYEYNRFFAETQYYFQPGFEFGIFNERYLASDHLFTIYFCNSISVQNLNTRGVYEKSTYAAEYDATIHYWHIDFKLYTGLKLELNTGSVRPFFEGGIINAVIPATKNITDWHHLYTLNGNAIHETLINEIVFAPYYPGVSVQAGINIHDKIFMKAGYDKAKPLESNTSYSADLNIFYLSGSVVLKKYD